MAFLRKEKQKSGTYLSIVENHRTEDGKIKQVLWYRLGKIEDYSSEALQRIATQLYQLGGGKLDDLLKATTKEIARYNYGFPLVIKKLLLHYKLEALFGRIQKKHKLTFSLFDTISLMLCDRINDPLSKLGTYNCQADYYGIGKVELQHIYRTLDKLSDYQSMIQKHLYERNKTLFNYEVDLVFYDVTTFYFDSEMEKEDSIRQKGFSKDGKIGQTQVLFGLLIDRNKNPIGYRIYSGNKYEGHTFKEAIEQLRKEYQLKEVVIVADRGMMNRANIALFEEEQSALGYGYIVGERLKNLKERAKEYLTNQANYKTSKWENKYGEQIAIQYCAYEYQGKMLIGSYSKSRAKKDKLDREKLLEKAKKLKVNPSQIEKKAARYFLKNNGESAYEIDEEKVKRAERFDGFMVIATNKKELTAEEALDKYKDLYKIEASFRTFKSYLETRPMYHWTDKRIEGHLCLCYIGFCLLNYLQQQLLSKNIIASENRIRKTFSKMQLSLIEQKANHYFLRSAIDQESEEIMKALNLPILNDIIPQSSISKYL